MGQSAAQLPLTQARPPHELPQVPQLSGSVFESMHRPAHSVSAAPHVAAQVPAAHRSPAAQTVPQAPQLVLSCFTSVQAPPQVS